MTKNTLRKEYKEKRKQLTQAQKEYASEKIAFSLMSLIPDGAVVHCFLPIEKFHELDVFFIIREMQKTKPNIQWVSSISNFEDLSMPCFALNIKQLTLNAYGIPEPSEPLTKIDAQRIEFVITPLLVCDTQGYRVGYGKGFYDRFFASLSSSCKKIGVNYFPILSQTIETNSFDIALDRHISPEGMTTFTL